MNRKSNWLAVPGTGEPRVGIFWLVEDRNLLLDSTPLSEAEPYGEYLTHPRSHIDQWEELQRQGSVAHDIEYEEPPRGRVVHNAKTERFVIYADPCILRRKDVIRKIMAAMHLPKNTVKTSLDAHYRCSQCLHG